jgi:hypothetical protein
MKPFGISLIVAAGVAVFYTILNPVERAPKSLEGQIIVVASIVVIGLGWSLATRSGK